MAIAVAVDRAMVAGVAMLEGLALHMAVEPPIAENERVLERAV